MKSRLLALTLLLAACTRSQSTSPIPAEPPVTLIATPPVTLPTAVASALATEAPPATPTQPTASERLPAGTPAEVPIPAPEGGWSLWRRGTDAGQLFRADSSGQIVEIRLPALDGTRPSPEYSLSPDGQLIFYTLLDAGGGVIARYFAVYEFSTGTLQTAALDAAGYGIVDYGALQAAFNPEGTQVAVTLEGNEEIDSAKVSFRVYLWDLKTNKVSEAITPETAIDRDLLPKEHIPLVIRWMPEGILLVGHLYQATNYTKTLLWNPAEDKIAAAPDTSSGFAFLGQRLAGGGEVVWPDYAETYPALPLDCWGSETPNNVVKYLDVAGGKTSVIFAAGASEQVGAARWLDGGQRLAILMIDCNRKATRLIVVDRSGKTNEAMPLAGKPAVFGAGGDLIVLDENLEANTTAIVAYDGQSNWAARELKTFAGALGAPGYGFNFVASDSAQADLKPFPEVGPESSRTGLEAGKRATVASSSGVLNIRTEPDKASPALGLLAAGSEVTILDGPVTAADGLVFWKVKAANGLVGWCVEAFEGEQTLIPKP